MGAAKTLTADPSYIRRRGYKAVDPQLATDPLNTQ